MNSFEERRNRIVSGINVGVMDSERTFLLLDAEGWIRKIRTNSNTAFYSEARNVGTPVHVFFGSEPGSETASVIVPSEVYTRFDVGHWRNDSNKHLILRLFYRYPDSIQKAILRRRMPSGIPQGNPDGFAHLQTRQQVEMKYLIWKHTFSDQQQLRLDTLLEPKNDRDKSFQQARLAIDIDPELPVRKTVSYQNAMEVLNSRVYGLTEAKEKFSEYLALCPHHSKRGGKFLLIGVPETEKKQLVAAVSEISGLPLGTINLAGISSALDLKGDDSGYSHSDAGRLVRTFYELGTAEAVLVLDGIDKMGKGDLGGNPAAALVDVLSDPSRCYDHFLEMAIHTEQTLFIATAESTFSIPEYLLDHFEIIRVDGYTCSGRKLK